MIPTAEQQAANAVLREQEKIAEERINQEKKPVFGRPEKWAPPQSIYRYDFWEEKKRDDF